jgi:hypothetical protein
MAGGAVEANGVLLTRPIFADDFVGPADAMAHQEPGDFTLAAGSNARDRGLPLPGINANAPGGADLGARELGCPAPIYGPRPVGQDHVIARIDCSADDPGETTGTTTDDTGSDDATATASADDTTGADDTAPAPTETSTPPGTDGPAPTTDGPTSVASTTGTTADQTPPDDGGCACRSAAAPPLLALVPLLVRRRRR